MCTIGKVPGVTIVDTTSSTVTFTADSKLASATSASQLAQTRVLGTYVVNVSDVWEPTATETSDHIPIPRHVVRAKGESGPIYLECVALRSPGTSALGPCLIRGSGGASGSGHTGPSCPSAPVIGDEQPIPLKWPDCGSLPDDIATYNVRPTGLQVVCVPLTRATQPVKIDLFNLAIAEAMQDLDLRGPCTTLKLTQLGCELLGVPYAKNGVQIFPLQILVTGIPTNTSGHAHSGTVDLRDQSAAGTVQHLSWTTPGQKELVLNLTSLGAGSTFGVFSQNVWSALAQLRDRKLREAVRVLWQAGVFLDTLDARGFHLADSAETREARQIIDHLRR